MARKSLHSDDRIRKKGRSKKNYNDELPKPRPWRDYEEVDYDYTHFEKQEQRKKKNRKDFEFYD